MPTRGELLTHLWRTAINTNLDASGLFSIIEQSKTRPKDPFADTGAALERLLATGASPSDLCLIRREAAFAAIFRTLYALEDPGVDDDNVLMLHEELLTSDPSGLDGRPGSAAAV